MTKRFLHLMSVVIIAVITASVARADQIDLFVMAGQSNMVGWRGKANAYPVDNEKIDSRIGLYWVGPRSSSSHGNWTGLQPQEGLFPEGHFGPEVTFSRELTRVGYRPFIFKYSEGSTSLGRNWLAPGAHGMYDAMVQELLKAIALQENLGNKPRVRALIWIQGESDAETDEMAISYQSRLRQLIDDFRKNVVKNPRLPIILGVDEQHPWVQARPIIVESQKRLAGMDSCEMFTSMVGLPKADSTHLTPAGLEAHGILLENAFLKLSKKCK